MRKGIDYVGVTVTFFCHDGQGNFVMSKRSANARDEQGSWDTGGGGLDFGMSVDDTLRKEVKEEYGADAISFEFLGYRDAFRQNQQGEKTHWLALDFKVLVSHDQIRNAEPHKFDDVAWFRLDALPSPLHSQLPFYLSRYKDRL